MGTVGVPEGITTLEDNKNSMKKRKYWALCGSFAGMLIFLVAIFLIYDYDPIRKQADSAINIVQTHQQDDSKIAHSEVLATESGEYLHCATDKKTGTFRYTKKKVKLTGREKNNLPAWSHWVYRCPMPICYRCIWILWFMWITAEWHKGRIMVGRVGLRER